MKKTTKLVSILLAIAMLITLIPANFALAATEVWDGTTATSFSQGGTGTETDPYKIANGKELALFRDKVNAGDLNICAELVADIYLNKDVLDSNYNLNSGTFHEWKPIGLFIDHEMCEVKGYKGIFNGNGNVVSGLYINELSYYYSGLFGGLAYNKGKSTIKNLGIVDSCVLKTMAVGGIVCALSKGSIQNCYSITRAGKNVYGIANNFGEATMLNCRSNLQPYSLSSAEGQITNSYQISIDAFKSGEVAYSMNGNTSRGELVWGQTLGTDQYPVKRNNNTVYKNFDGYSNHEHSYNNGFCTVCDGYQPAKLNPASNYYEISNAGQLFYFAKKVNDGSKSINGTLVSDVDLNTKKWQAINEFGGTFDGQSHSIKNLNQNSGLGNGGRQGLVKLLSSSGTVKNVTFEKADIWSTGYSGAVAHENNGYISNCIVTNSYIALGNDSTLGGVSGENRGTITNCALIGSTVERRWGGTGKALGGITQNNTGIVSNCFTYSCTFGSTSADNGAIVTTGTAPTNSYYYTASAVSAKFGIAKTTKQFESGEIAYLLGKAWGQMIGKDPIPTRRTAENQVQYVNGKYSNGVWDGSSATSFSKGGSGTLANPYKISTGNELSYFKDLVNGGQTSICGELTGDIVVNVSVLNPDGTLNVNEIYKEWTPIGNETQNYTGTFNGAGYTVRGVYIDTKTLTYVGLFGYMGEGGVIKNLVTADGYLCTSVSSSADAVGGICGFNQKGTIENCFNSSTINAKYSGDIGGICGNNSYGTIKNCYNTGLVSSINYVSAGGIAGNGWSDSYYNCFNLGKVSSANSDKVYQISHPSSYDKCVDCYFKKTEPNRGLGTGIDASKFTNGELVWILNGSSSDGVWGQNLMTDSHPVFSSKYKVYQVKCDHGFGIYSNTDSKTISSYDENDKCTVCGNIRTIEPKRNAEGFYEIDNINNFLWFAGKVNCGNTNIKAKLLNDINLQSTDKIQIGSATNKYIGTFDGNGKTVIIKVENATTEGMGLFHTLEYGAYIKNLNVVGSISTSKQYAGGIAGYVSGNSTIENCIVNVAFDFTSGGKASIGGIVGIINNGKLIIKNCGVLGSFTTTSSTTPVEGIGGMVGLKDQNVHILNSYVTATLTNATANDSQNITRHYGNFDNCYYKNQFATSTQGIQKTEAQFKSGEVAYLLGEGWGQKIGTDKYPVPGGEKVYFEENKYFNKIPASVKISDDGTIVTANTTSACILAIASYNGDKLLEMKTYDILASETKIIANELNLSGATEIKAFMWESLGNTKPLCNFDAKTLQQ